MARYELNLRDYYRIVRRHIIVVFAVSVGLGGMTFTLSPTEPTYRATATVRITQASDLTSLLLETFYWSPEDNISTQTMLISSQPVLLKVAQSIDPAIYPGFSIPRGIDQAEAMRDPDWRAIIANLSGKIEAHQVEFSGLVDIIAHDRTPDIAMDLARLAADAYKEYSDQNSRRQVTEARTFIETQIDTISEELNTAQLALREFRERSLPYSTAETSSLVPLLDRRRTLWDRLLDLQEQNRRLGGEGPIISQGVTLEAGTAAPYTESYNQLSALNADRNRLLLTYTPEAEPIRSLDSRIREIRVQLRTTIQQDIALLSTQLDELDELLGTYPYDEIQLAALTRDVELNTELLTQLRTSLQEVRIREAETGKEVSIVNYPTSAISDQQSGRGLKTIVGLLLGLMLGMVMAFVLETLDTSIGTIEDVEEYLEVPVLAVIPHLDVDKMAARLIEDNPQLADDKNLEMYARLITQYDPRSPAAEAYRTLRTNLQFATAGAGEMMETKNTFVFTSSSLQEGKSTTLVNLAITVAQAGNRVLLMGCNMRRPTIYKSFGLTRDRGMTDILTGQKEWRDCVKGVTDMMVGPLSLQNIMSMPGLDNLHIVTAGGIPPNPSELLNSPRFGQMVEEASKEYDLVLVDCPPILPVTDAAIVSRQVDWAVLIYQVGKVPRNALRRAKFHISNVGAHVLGIAMNDVKAEIGGYSPYSQYMVKYYGEEAKVSKTLWDRLRGLFLKKTEDRKDRSAPRKTLLQRLFGGKEKIEEEGRPGWIDVRYRNDKEEQEDGEGSAADLESLPFSQVTGEDDDKEVGGDATQDSGLSTPAFDISDSAEESQPDEEPVPDEEDEEQESAESWLSRIPLWQWIALGALIIIAILSIIFGFWSGNGASSETNRSATEIQQTPVPPPVESSRQTPSAPVTSLQETTSETIKVWSILVGSFRTAEEAESFIKAAPPIGSASNNAYWYRAEEIPNMGIWYRVFAGQYSNMEECQRIAQTIRESNKVPIALVRLISPPIM